jgi:hypothetical protein
MESGLLVQACIYGRYSTGRESSAVQTRAFPADDIVRMEMAKGDRSKKLSL